jgi:hypothetical protein
MKNKWVEDGPFLRLVTPEFRTTLIKGVELAVPLDAVLEVDGVERYATFFTMDSISELIRKWEISGENLGGGYFWSINSIILAELNLDLIELVLTDLVETGKYRSAFGEGP